MPKEETQEETQPVEAEITAADLLELGGEDTEESPVEDALEGDEDESEEESPEEADEEAGDEDEEEDESAYEIRDDVPETDTIDPQTLALLPEEARTEVERIVTERNNLQTWANALNDPATRSDAFRQLLGMLGASEGKTADDLARELFQEGAGTQGEDAPEGFEYETDRLVYERAKADAKAEVMQEVESLLGPIKDLIPSLKELHEERQKAQQETQIRQDAARLLPEYQRIVAQANPRFEVTQEKVATALRKAPQYRNKPLDAMRLAYGQEWDKSLRKSVSTKKGPEAVRSGKSPGTPLRDPRELKAIDIIRELDR